MDVLHVLDKLEPLMPKQVKRWRIIRESADAEMRSLLDQVVLRKGREVLGDLRNAILLSLPPRNLARGTFGLGTVRYEKPKWLLGLRVQEVLQNLAVFGRSGAGKTNVVFHLLEQLSHKKVPWLFLDWKRTARHLLPRLRTRTQVYTPGRSLSPLAFNPFIIPPGIETSVYANHVVDVLSEAFSLGEGSRSVIQRALGACFEQSSASPTIQDVITEVNGMSSTGRVGSWKVSALRALNGVAFSKLASTRLTRKNTLNRSCVGRQSSSWMDLQTA